MSEKIKFSIRLYFFSCQTQLVTSQSRCVLYAFNSLYWKQQEKYAIKLREEIKRKAKEEYEKCLKELHAVSMEIEDGEAYGFYDGKTSDEEIDPEETEAEATEPEETDEKELLAA